MSSNAVYFCPACSFANPYILASKPSKCNQCGCNFAFAKFSSAPVAQAAQVVYQEPPRRAVKARYVEVEEEDEYLDDIDEKSIAAAIKIDSGRPVRGVKLEDAIANGQPLDTFGRQTGPALSNEEIIAKFRASNDKKWNLSDGPELND